MAYRSSPASRRRRAIAAFARRYWLSATLLLFALMIGAASWIVFDRGTASPDEPPRGEIDLVTTHVDGPVQLYVSFLMPSARAADAGQLWPAVPRPISELASARSLYISLSGPAKPGAHVAWSLQLTGSARMSDPTFDQTTTTTAGELEDPPTSTPCRCQYIVGESIADAGGHFAAGLMGTIDKPVATTAAGLTYVHLPAIQVGLNYMSNSPLGSLEKPKDLTIDAPAGSLGVGDAVTSVYPENGVSPTKPMVFRQQSGVVAEDSPGLAIHWSGKELPTLRAEITNRQKQRQASILVFTAGGLLGLAAAMLLEAILKFHEAAPTGRPPVDRHRRLVAMHRRGQQRPRSRLSRARRRPREEPGS